MNKVEYCIINGQLVEHSKASFPINDLATIRGYGIFDYFQVIDGVPLFIESYLERFTRSAVLNNMNLSYDAAAIHKMVLELIQANSIKHAGIRLLLTGGYAADGYTPVMCNFAILPCPFATYDASTYTNGLKLMTHRYLRDFPEIKTTNYSTVIRLRDKLKSVTANDVLFHDGVVISESSRANFFIVTPDNALVTAAEGILKGITRKNIIQVAKAMGIKVETRTLLLKELATAKEAFVSSSTKGAMAVTRVDDLIIGTGQAGDMTLKIQAAVQALTKQYILAHS